MKTFTQDMISFWKWVLTVDVGKLRVCYDQD